MNSDKKLNLTVIIDPKSGFCFGVITAVQKAEAQLTKNSALFSLGEIVHNEAENARLEKMGMVTITRDQLNQIHNSVVLFRAHGEPPESYRIAKDNNNTIIDASCPIIIKLQERIKKSYANGEKIYIYGQHNHPEIIGLNGQIDNAATIFESIEELDISSLPRKISLYSQTTKSLEKFQEIFQTLTNSGIEVDLYDTVCRQVSNRQTDLFSFCKSHDIILFLAGKNSSNGKILFNVCKGGNTNTIFITEPSEIKKEWFSHGMKVGITGATSTPMWQMEKAKCICENF